MVALNEASVPVGDLILDPNNYRFQDAKDFVPASEARFAEKSVQSKAFSRLRDEGLSELKASILHNGFLPFERIVVRTYEFDSDKYLVLEGNRRVAALKWIAQDDEAGVSIPLNVATVLQAVPVIVVGDLGDDPALPLSLMGVRHVGGIRQWGGYQRAKLVTELRDRFSLDTGEVAARLGMSAHEVNRRYRAYKALQQMMTDEEYADVSEPEMYPLFHEAVSGRTVKDWLGWNEETLAFQNADALRQFYELVTPVQSEEGADRPPKIVTYQHVRDLREILPIPEARRRLLDADSSFSDALAIAKADDLAKSWVSQAAEAVVALKSVGALELRRLPADDLQVIRELSTLSGELLHTYEILQGAHALAQ